MTNLLIQGKEVFKLGDVTEEPGFMHWGKSSIDELVHHERGCTGALSTVKEQPDTCSVRYF